MLRWTFATYTRNGRMKKIVKPQDRDADAALNAPTSKLPRLFSTRTASEIREGMREWWHPTFSLMENREHTRSRGEAIRHLWRWGLKGSEKEGRQMSEIPENIGIKHFITPNNKRAFLANSRKCAAS